MALLSALGKSVSDSKLVTRVCVREAGSLQELSLRNSSVCEQCLALIGTSSFTSSPSFLTSGFGEQTEWERDSPGTAAVGLFV